MNVFNLIKNRLLWYLNLNYYYQPKLLKLMFNFVEEWNQI